MRVPEMEPYQSLNLVAIDELRTVDYERYHIRHYVLKYKKDLEFFGNLFLLAQTMDIQSQESVIDTRNHIDITEEKHFQQGIQRIDKMFKTTSVLEQTKANFQLSSTGLSLSTAILA